MSTSYSRFAAAAALFLIVGVAGATLIRPSHSAGGAVPVQVTGTTIVSDTDNAARHPFQYDLSPSSSTSPSATAGYTVPAGKRLVIEYLSAQLTQYPSGGCGYMYLVTTSGGDQEYYKVIPPVSSTTPKNQMVRIYADPGTTVQGLVTQSSGTSCGGIIILSGISSTSPDERA